MPTDIAQKARDLFAKNLEIQLERFGKTQADIAAQLGVSASTVSDWANGKKYPRVDKMQRIADYLGIPVSALRDDPSLPEEPELKMPYFRFGQRAQEMGLTQRDMDFILDFMADHDRRNREEE